MGVDPPCREDVGATQVVKLECHAPLFTSCGCCVERHFHQVWGMAAREARMVHGRPHRTHPERLHPQALPRRTEPSSWRPTPEHGRHGHGGAARGARRSESSVSSMRVQTQRHHMRSVTMDSNIAEAAEQTVHSNYLDRKFVVKNGRAGLPAHMQIRRSPSDPIDPEPRRLPGTLSDDAVRSLLETLDVLATLRLMRYFASTFPDLSVGTFL